MKKFVNKIKLSWSYIIKTFRNPEWLQEKIDYERKNYVEKYFAKAWEEVKFELLMKQKDKFAFIQPREAYSHSIIEIPVINNISLFSTSDAFLPDHHKKAKYAPDAFFLTAILNEAEILAERRFRRDFSPFDFETCDLSNHIKRSIYPALIDKLFEMNVITVDRCIDEVNRQVRLQVKINIYNEL